MFKRQHCLTVVLLYKGCFLNKTKAWPSATVIGAKAGYHRREAVRMTTFDSPPFESGKNFQKPFAVYSLLILMTVDNRTE